MIKKKILFLPLSGSGEDSRGGHVAMEEHLSNVHEANFLASVYRYFICMYT